MVEIDTRKLRNVLGCYATGVAVITTRAASGDHIGVTVNSFSSVSLDPPLILFSLVRTANVLPGFRQATNFVVNILGQGQQTLSNMFAKPSTACWSDVNFSAAANGCALFADSLAHLECNKTEELDGGDHLIFFGAVTSFHLRSPADPLLFYRGGYGTYKRDQWSKMPSPDGSLSEFVVPGWG
jgi:3-hydroxy-9,10-secoandrosta-1,3,5(10)-triene-9,17-dione monooxygenase reductase component